MDINLKEINSYTQELTVGLEWNELSDDFNKFIGKFGKQIKMPGFRPGKVPKPVLMKQFLPEENHVLLAPSRVEGFLKFVKVSIKVRVKDQNTNLLYHLVQCVESAI